MQILSLRKSNKRHDNNANNNANKQTKSEKNFSKLPILETASQNNSEKMRQMKQNTIDSVGIQLPPISRIAPTVNDSNLNYVKSTKMMKFESQLNDLKLLFDSNAPNESSFKRTNSLNKLSDNEMAELKRYSHLCPEFSLLNNKETYSSIINSVAATVAGMKRRPKTIPFSGKNNTINVRQESKVSVVVTNERSNGKKLVSPPKDHVPHHNIRIKSKKVLSSPQKLPPIKMRKSKKENKMRCSQCRKKLGLANRYDCRFVCINLLHFKEFERLYIFLM